jgi:hypothetical protein
VFFNHLYSLGETYKICSNIFVILRLGGELIVKNLCFLIISILSLISCEVQTGTKVNHQRVKHIRFVANIFVILRLGGELVVKSCGFFYHLYSLIDQLSSSNRNIEVNHQR